MRLFFVGCLIRLKKRRFPRRTGALRLPLFAERLPGRWGHISTREFSNWLRGPEHTVVPICVASLLAGFIIWIAAAKRFPSPQKPFESAATRAGFTAALIAAATLVLRATWLHGRAGHVAENALITLFIALVTILPATFVAMFMGVPDRALRLTMQGDSATGNPPFSLRPIHGLYSVCVFPLLSPFVPSIINEPATPALHPAGIASRRRASNTSPFNIYIHHPGRLRDCLRHASRGNRSEVSIRCGYEQAALSFGRRSVR